MPAYFVSLEIRVKAPNEERADEYIRNLAEFVALNDNVTDVWPSLAEAENVGLEEA